MNNIKNSSFRDIKLNVIRDEYWDFILARDGADNLFLPNHNSDDCLISYIDTTDESIVENNLYSLNKYIWEKAINNGVELHNIGFTGMDDGLITFKKDRISNQEFYNLFTNSQYNVPENDFRLYLTKVTGNTQVYTYPTDTIIENNKKYIKLNGGFYQGFFKLEGNDYQTLPTVFEDDFHLEFVIRKQDYEEPENTLNNTHPNNKGIFFYVGTRAENKFYRFYNVDESIIENRQIGYLEDDDYSKSKNYFKNEANPEFGDYFYGTEPEIDKLPILKEFVDEAYFANNCIINDCKFTIDNYVEFDEPCCCQDYDCCNKQPDCKPINTCEPKPPIKKPVNNHNAWFNVYGYATSNICPEACCVCGTKKITKPVIKKTIKPICGKCGGELITNDTEIKPCACTNDSMKPLNNGYPNPYWMARYEDEYCKTQPDEPKCGCEPIKKCSDDYFNDDYFDLCNRGCNIPTCCEDDSKYLLEDDYFQEEVSLSDVVLNTYDGLEMNKNGYYDIKSDNKFLFFNRTHTGYTTHTWSDDLDIILRGIKHKTKENYFLLFNRTCTGLTTDTIDDYFEKVGYDYDILKDLYSNAFALMVNDDGSIGYRYLVRNCDTETGFDILSEFSKPGIIKTGEWATINVRFKIFGGVDNCGKPLGPRKMKLYIYVNGFLKLITKELPELRLRALGDVPEKQETVPYNISLGGGTQGLADEIWINYYDIPTKILPLEKNFAGTFIGDFKSFKIYNCFQNYPIIKNNFKYTQISV